MFLLKIRKISTVSGRKKVPYMELCLFTNNKFAEDSFFGVFDRTPHYNLFIQSVCVEVLRPSQPNGVMSSAVSLPSHTFTGQA